MKEFLIEHWEILVDVVLLVSSIILFVLRKKPVKVIDSISQKIMFYAPSFIRAAEAKFGAGHGPEKLNYVIDLFKDMFEKDGIELNHYRLQFIILIVKDILQTPQSKKED